MNYFVKLLQNLNCSIRYKLGLAFALLLICFSIDGIISILLLSTIQGIEAQQKINNTALQELQYNELTFNNKIGLYQNAIFVTKTPAIIDNFRVNFDFSDKNPQHQAFETQFASLYSKSLNHFDHLNSLLQATAFDAAATSWQQYLPDFTNITNLITTHKNYLQQSSTDAEQQLSSAITLSIGLIVVITALSILLAIFLLFLLDNLLIRPINTLQQGLQKVAEGELDQHITVSNRDEMGKLASSFDLAVRALRQVIQSVQIGESLTTMATQLSGASSQQTVYASQQVSAISELTSVLQELGQTASQIAESATRVSQKAEQTLEQIGLVEKARKISYFHSQQMVNVVTNTLSGVERVGDQVDVISQKMLELDEQSQAIGKVVEILRAISNNIHLLSLNAAIEAAGASEHGDRFGVIAREIRELAKRSSIATEEVSLLVSQVQNSSQQVVEQVRAGQVEVQAVVQTNSSMTQGLQELEVSAVQVGDAVIALMGLANEVNREAEVIKQATLQQHISNQQVISTAYSVNEVVQETVALTQNVATNSTELENVALQLNGVLGQVRLVT